MYIDLLQVIHPEINSCTRARQWHPVYRRYLSSLSCLFNDGWLVLQVIVYFVEAASWTRSFVIHCLLINKSTWSYYMSWVDYWVCTYIYFWRKKYKYTKEESPQSYEYSSMLYEKETSTKEISRSTCTEVRYQRPWHFGLCKGRGVFLRSLDTPQISITLLWCHMTS